MTIFGINLSMMLLSCPINFTWGLSVGKGEHPKTDEEEEV